MLDSASTESGRRGSSAVRSRAVVLLGLLVTVLAVAASLSGVVSTGGLGTSSFTTVRGTAAELYGEGLYRHDTVFVGAGNRGTDVATLALGSPLLIAALTLYLRRSPRGPLLLCGALAYFLYVYASLALAAAFNDLFLVYVAVFSASLYGLVLLLRELARSGVFAGALATLPRRSLGVYLLVAAAVTAFVWLSPVVQAVLEGGAPVRMDSATTAVTYALDLAIIVPAACAAGYLVLRREPMGYLIATPLLGIIVLLGPAILAQTLWQLHAGVELSPPEVVGPVAGFLVMGVLALGLFAALLRRVTALHESSSTR